MNFTAQLKNMVSDTSEFVKKNWNATPLEKKLNAALSDVNWNSSSTEKADIAAATHDYDSFRVIFGNIWETMSYDSRKWRQVFKALDLLEYLIKHGTPR